VVLECFRRGISLLIAMTTNLAKSMINLYWTKHWSNFKVGKWVRIALLLSALAGGGVLAFRQFVVLPRLREIQQLPTDTVQRISLPVTVSANGTVEPERSINVSPKSSGVLKRLMVKEGDRVKQGQILAYMDDSNLRGQFIQAQGQLQEAEVNLQRARNGNRTQDISKAAAELEEAEASLQEVTAGNRRQDITQAQARLKNAQAALTQAEDLLQRNQTLYKERAISRSDLNQKQADRDKAQAEVWERQQAVALLQAGSRPEAIAQARARVKQRQEALALLQAGNRPEDIAQNQAKVVAARGTLQNIQAQIEDTVLRAPFSGVVIKKYADPGAFVAPTTAGSEVSGAASNSILSLASTNQVIANLAETSISQIRLGQTVKITADAYPEKQFTGRVTQIAAQAAVQQNVTSFEVKVALLGDAQTLLRSKMNVEAEFQVGRVNNALAVPSAAIVRQEGGSGVYVMQPEQGPEFITIETGATVQNKTVVKSGLKGDERILLSFPPGLRPKRNFTPPGFGGGRRSSSSPSPNSAPPGEPPSDAPS
jgi:HlyD family secretion protein